MKSVIGVFHSYDKAINAINDLGSAGYPVEKLTLISQREIVFSRTLINSIFEREVGISAAIGMALGILNGKGVLAIPGFEFLKAWGSYLGAFIGFLGGILGATIILIATSLVFEIWNVIKSEECLNEGKFKLMINGDEEETSMAREILLSKPDYAEAYKN